MPLSSSAAQQITWPSHACEWVPSCVGHSVKRTHDLVAEVKRFATLHDIESVK